MFKILFCFLPIYLQAQTAFTGADSINISFICEHIRNSSEGKFWILYHHGKEVDNIMKRRNYTRDVLCRVISRENTDSILSKAFLTGVAPSWNVLRKKIAVKVDATYAELTIMDAQLMWYLHTKERAKFCNLVIRRVDKYGPYGPIPDIDWQFNSCAWDIFLYSDIKSELMKALQWSDSARLLSPKPNAEYLDTHANILYKMGRIKEAVEYQERAVAMQPDQKDLQETLQKMLGRQPTWLP